MLDVKIKKLREDAVIPRYMNATDAGMDMYATSIDIQGDYDHKEYTITYGTGLSVEIPDGYVGLLFPRSSIFKYGLQLANSVGVVDSGYRGEVMFKFKTTGVTDKYAELVDGRAYTVGERVGQLIILPYPKVNFVEISELSASDRGEYGFGSTGVK